LNNIDAIRELYEVVKDRKENPISESYTNYLFEKGLDKI
jgi:Phosphoribosyl-ATP pyrophosphohydrolase